MAELSVVQRYRSALRRLLPPGKAFDFVDGSTAKKFFDAQAEEFARVEERGAKFLDELDPRTSFEMLDSWERLLGIPDECTPTDYEPSLSQRRARILQKLTTGGGQSKAFYRLIASQLGYSLDAIDAVNFTDFRAGLARAGDAISNSVNSAGVVTGWPYTFKIVAPAAFVRRFTAGQSLAGERLVLPENETLECVIRKFAPAHATVLFSFE